MMKNLDAFLAELSDLDIRLWVEGDRLRCNAPKGTVTPSIRYQLAERKAEILTRLRGSDRAGDSSAKLMSISRSPRQGNLPLSFAQQRLWILDQMSDADSTYNEVSALKIEGSIKIDALERSLREIVSRHEILRTSFPSVNGSPVQVIAEHPANDLLVVDWQHLTEAEQSIELERSIAWEIHQPFDLARGPLLRQKLLQLAPEKYVFLFAKHHIICDYWSGRVFIRELTVLYKAFSENKPSPLPELPIQYADYAVWQRQYLQGEVLAAQVAYWKQQLGSNLPVLQLPTSRPRSAVKTNRSASCNFVIPSPLFQKIAALNRQENVTPFMTLLSTLNILLQRYTNQDDIVVGTDVTNQNRAELDSLIGFFVNILVLRVDLSGNPKFRELLKQVRQVALGAYSHQDLPFEQLVKELQPNRQSTHTPLFQVLFVFQNALQSSSEQLGLKVSELPVKKEFARFDLTLFLTETEGGILGEWQYNADLFEALTISRMSNHFLTLLDSIVKQPDARINNLEMLTETEREQKTMKSQQQKEQKRQKFKKVKPKVVDLSQVDLIRTSSLQQDAKLPLVITPNVEEIDIRDWAGKNREFLETKLLHHGAILFRDFGFDKLSDFEALAEAICPSLFEKYGDLPREGVSDKIYKSTPYPSEQAILYHNESSHLDSWPQKIWFFCIKKAQEGGETPIVDCRKVFQMLDPTLRKAFEEKQLMYVRNYTDGLDVSWQDFFRTDDKMVVEKRCSESSILFEWKSDGGLKTKQIRPAIIKHPHTGESVFFNQIQLHHAGYLKPEVRESLLGLYGEDNLPRHVYYGDGSPIEESVIQEVLDIYQKASVSEPWQQGDVLMLDNMLTAHGRNPYVGDRKIAVAMANMIHSTDLKY